MVVMLFLTGMVAIIFMKTLNKDIATLYSSEEEMKDDQEDNAGWKLVHGDVFRTPSYSSLLCPILGSGVQILVMTFSTISKSLDLEILKQCQEFSNSDITDFNFLNSLCSPWSTESFL